MKKEAGIKLQCPKCGRNLKVLEDGFLCIKCGLAPEDLGELTIYQAIEDGVKQGYFKMVEKDQDIKVDESQSPF